MKCLTFLALLCATVCYSADDHQVAIETATAIRSCVPRDIAKAREKGPQAVAKVERKSKRWLLGTKRCSPEDRDMLDRTLAECLAFRGSYADAKRQFRKDRWAYIGGMITAPSCVPTQPNL